MLLGVDGKIQIVSIRMKNLNYFERTSDAHEQVDHTNDYLNNLGWVASSVCKFTCQGAEEFCFG